MFLINFDSKIVELLWFFQSTNKVISKSESGKTFLVGSGHTVVDDRSRSGSKRLEKLNRTLDLNKNLKLYL
jgi:hypothetical protein